jgi:uncharacterized repeat protein (TIGR03803 family)
MLCSGSSYAATYKVLKSLTSLDGIHPEGGLVFDAAGNLYGTSSFGGGPLGAGYGSVFELEPSNSGPWRERALHIFQRNSRDGEFPHWNPIFDPQGNLYGTTSSGGVDGYYGGTIFELTPTAQELWKETLIYQFHSYDGYDPNQILRDDAGNFYGTTEGGGVHGFYYDFGLAYKLTPMEGGGYTQQVLHYFTTADNDGMSPRSNLVQDVAGNFYGTTKGGGLYDQGSVFELSQSVSGGWHEQVIYSFSGKDGWWPIGSIAIDAAGNIYGTTKFGGTPNSNIGPGNLFELSPAGDGTWTEKNIHVFEANDNDGYQPLGGVTLDADGNLFGTTYGGGPANAGTVFEFSPTDSGVWTGHILHSFNGVDGGGPSGQLILDNNGNLYGTTAGGGEDYNGVVFEITP